MVDKNVIEQARNTDIIAFFEQRYGYTFAHRGGAYRCRQHPSLAVDSNRRSWFWHSKGIGGFGVLDYLIKAENIPFRQAVEAVTGISFTIIQDQPRNEAEKPKTLVLPEKAGLQLHLYDYLCNKRSIGTDIVNALMEKGKLYEDGRRNVVFVGFDEQGKARFASLRGTHGNFRMDCAGSDKKYSFHMAYVPSERLYIFESPIDAMSHATLENINVGHTGAWEQHYRLSLAGTTDTAIPFFLNQHYEVKELVFNLDNDHAGREAAVNMAKKYTEKGYFTRLELPQGKDFNEDLQAVVKKIRAERSRKLKDDICI